MIPVNPEDDAEGPGAGAVGHPVPLDALTDVTGIRVGHAEVTGAGALSGTTVVLAPAGGEARPAGGRRRQGGPRA
ncbi:peptidase S58 family protein, partial [Streptomyces griseus]|uniref:P1 family peptidase n=1 Tax=Streptomyces griseus TaxID=1911 RepID=UPI001C565AE3